MPTDKCADCGFRTGNALVVLVAGQTLILCPSCHARRWAIGSTWANWVPIPM